MIIYNPTSLLILVQSHKILEKDGKFILIGITHSSDLQVIHYWPIILCYKI